MNDNHSLSHSKWNCKYHMILNLGVNEKNQLIVKLRVRF